ncbi:MULTISPECIES: class I ribonucleotide reductase maintenance protein YfaE [Enterobacteriaceae]|uniref:class I ribonucleotide reductase maintenance protein YfaE n=1 Tax=Enterobacteriaceae TaxID=543 RepID=UPI001C9A9E69|nr:MULTISPECIES: class I ribonucleotide reductase maintenance protein YfaE [Klebsiella]MCG8665414.1 class I ribonucleotide reductase maintenance protein YfaE [Klebsiella michiganensis]MCP6139022.1 class I ribonucleotide reductase maintenance protein YfaE [Klebsiella pneumoniae]
MSGNFNCQIVFTEQNETVITGEDAVTTILEQLESAGIQVESQCRSGYCGACRLKKKSGEVKYDNDPLAYVGQDEILPCCCRPCGPLVLAI